MQGVQLRVRAKNPGVPKAWCQEMLSSFLTTCGRCEAHRKVSLLSRGISITVQQYYKYKLSIPYLKCLELEMFEILEYFLRFVGSSENLKSQCSKI